MANQRIFLVDDEEMILKALERELEDFARCREVEIVSWTSPMEALREIRRNPEGISMVVSDQRMPGLKGYDLLNLIRQENENIILILLSAYTDIEDIIESIRIGLFSFILKPWDINLLVHEMETGLDLYRLRQENERNTRLLGEALQWGGEIQRKLLASPPPKDPRIAFSINYSPLERYSCGGDYYDVIPFDEHRYMVFLGDVSGHGVKAAFVTFILKTLLNEAVAEKSSLKGITPAAVLTWLNPRLCRELKSVDTIIVTFTACMVDLENMTLAVANAGHLPVAILRDGHCTTLSAEGTAMGFSPDIIYSEKRVPLLPGDRIVLYTDGLVEALDDPSVLKEIFRRNLGSPSFADTVVAEVLDRIDGRAFDDDVAVLSALVSS